MKKDECGDLSTIYDTSYAYLGRVYLGPCQSHLKYIDYYRRIFKYYIKNSLTYKLMILFTRTVIFKIYMYIITRNSN